MVLPALSRAAQVAATRIGVAAAPALAQSSANAGAAAARTAVAEVARYAAAGLAPRATTAGGIASALAPRGGAPGAVKKVCVDFAESAAADAFSRTTGIQAPTSPTLGGFAYDMAKGALFAQGASQAWQPPSLQAAHAPGATQPETPAAFERPAIDMGLLAGGPLGGGSLALQQFLKEAQADK